MKRFYETVGTRQVDGGWQVTLDGRGLKTVKSTPQIVPTQSFASALAAEWESQGEDMNPNGFALRDTVDYAIDVVAADRPAMAEKIATYGDTDTLLYRANPDEPLYARQMEVWEPIVAAFETREGVELVRISGIIHRPQSDAALDILRGRLGQLSPFTLAGIEAMASLAASLIVALSAAEATQQDEVLELWRAASLEEEWQADLWGRDYEAEDRRAKRQNDFLKAWDAVRLAQI